MPKFSRIFAGLLVLLLIAIPATAKDQITYDFDEEVEVEYAAEFTAMPVTAEVYGWVADIAGGADKPLQVLYGIVSLKQLGTQDVLQEEFIKISGENGSERFLLNSMTTGWYDEGTYSQLKFRKTFFWSAKKLDGSTVVKDFSLPIHSVTMKKNFDYNKRLTSIDIYFSDDGDQAGQDFWSEIAPDKNVYQADMTTLEYYGDVTAGDGESPK